VRKAPGKPFLIGIEGIQSSADFASVETYLKSLSQVIDVNIHQLLGQVAIFEITPRGDDGAPALQEAITMGNNMIPALGSNGIAGVEFVYRWTGEPTERQALEPPVMQENLPPDPAPPSLWDEGDED
jgi:hypothetical protein